jgi:hypothetical protein
MYGFRTEEERIDQLWLTADQVFATYRLYEEAMRFPVTDRVQMCAMGAQALRDHLWLSESVPNSTGEARRG